MPTSCCAISCKNRHFKGSPIRFFSIPKEPFRRELWLIAIRRNKNWTPGSGSDRVCSAHFVTGVPSKHSNHPDYVPSIFAHKSRKQSKRNRERFERNCKRRKSYASMIEPEEEYLTNVENSENSTNLLMVNEIQEENQLTEQRETTTNSPSLKQDEKQLMTIKQKTANLMRITRTRDYAASHKQLESLRPRNEEQTVVNNLLHAALDALEGWLDELKYIGKISCSKEDCGQVFCSEVEMLYHWLDCCLLGFYTSSSREKSTTIKPKASSDKKMEIQNDAASIHEAGSSRISLNCASPNLSSSSQLGMKDSSLDNVSVSQKGSSPLFTYSRSISRCSNTRASNFSSTERKGSLISKSSVSHKSMKKDDHISNVTKKAIDCGSKNPQVTLPAAFLHLATNRIRSNYCASSYGSKEPKRECPDMLHNKALAMDDKDQPDAIVPDRENSGTSFNSSILSVKQEDCEEIVIKIEPSDFPEDEMDSENGSQLQEFDYGNDSVQHDSVLGFGMPTFNEKQDSFEERPTCSGSSVADVITPLELVCNMNTQLNSMIEIEMD